MLPRNRTKRTDQSPGAGCPRLTLGTPPRALSPSGTLRPPGDGARLWSSAMELAERSLLDALSYLECALGILAFVLLKLVGSPYGRYASQHSAWRLAAPTAWALQELPSLAVPLFVCAGTPAERLHWWPNRILLAMFIVHYVQR